jgi:hypothetical protein
MPTNGTTQNADVAIPIVFPDYRLTLEIPEVAVTVPDLIPWGNVLPDRIRIPGRTKRIENLGHAGILLVEGSTGRTRYYEYGRYDVPWFRGAVRPVPVTDVKIGRNGRSTRKSLASTLARISTIAGQSGPIAGAYIELPPGAFLKMDGYAVARMRANFDPKREPYALAGNSCLDFMKRVAEAGGAKMPVTVPPHPAGYVVLLQMLQPDLAYDARTTVVIEDLELE